MGISKATFTGVLASLIVMTTGPARAYDFSKPLSCAVTVYRGGSAMWTWVDVSNGTGNRVVKEAGPVTINGREDPNHTPRECQESCVRGRLSHHASTNLSSNMIAN